MIDKKPPLLPGDQVKVITSPGSLEKGTVLGCEIKDQQHSSWLVTVYVKRTKEVKSFTFSYSDTVFRVTSETEN